MARIGVSNLVYAIMTAEGDKATLPTWDTPKNAPGVMSVNINANPDQATLFYDDGPGDTATTLGIIETEINKAELTTENKADLLGHTIDNKGGLVFGNSDNAPWVAIGFKSLKSNGSYRYVWMYQGKFKEPEDNNETKGETINFQPDVLVGQFVKIATECDVLPEATGSYKTYPWKYEIDEDYATADAALITAWFNAVQTPVENP